jgi:CRISPR-associated endonuclease/helicase Cas3
MPTSYYQYWGKADEPLKAAYCSGLDKQQICKDHSEKIAYRLGIAKKLVDPKYLDDWAEKEDKKTGKTKWTHKQPNYAAYHLLPYHCLDVAAVANCWWQASPSLRQQFTQTMQLENEQQTKAWVLFFVALHDYGKFDVRFQSKAPNAHQQVQPDFNKDLIDLNSFTIKEYAHGDAGFSLFYQDFQSVFAWSKYDTDLWDQWQPYLAAVMGHHGSLPDSIKREYFLNPSVDSSSTLKFKQQTDFINAEKQARLAWVSALEILFLIPAQLSLHSPPPNFQPLMTGFCSVCDWLGSKAENNYFTYQTKAEELEPYFNKRLIIADKLIRESGLIGEVKHYSSVQALLDTDYLPRQLQTVVDDLPPVKGLTIIEAPTGSGKTEAALAYAWRLLDAQLADSIVFALPTQATSNAMFERLIRMATVLFGKADVVLAHGKAQFNDKFWQLKQASERHSAQGEQEANIQCAAWLASSRKRVFLGQIGVCTVDQVLVSVLPMRHNFVRGFGLGKSVLIVDEVHAYDRYMIGLLDEVISQQKQSGGSVILLSATLPALQKQVLLNAWGTTQTPTEQESYPLITHSDTHNKITPFVLEEQQQPKTTTISIEVLAKPDLLPDDELKQKMLQAAKGGAQVVFICNLVDVAQALAEQLQQSAYGVEIELFHARYRFCDRQTKEKKVLDFFGKDGKREQGRILIATQVVEQSLDLDFDWMLTQLCPVDLLFQRLGRLHRHERKRPKGFEQPRCTVLIPDNDDYGLHKVIYGNSRVLWRTAQLLKNSGGKIEFPKAYRDWIEQVYQEDPWQDESSEITQSYETFLKNSDAAYYCAKNIVKATTSALSDTDGNVSFLTRDGEMNLNVLPVMETTQGQQLLDGTLLINIENWFKDEAINQNIVGVPRSWRDFLPKEKDGLICLVMQQENDYWYAESNGKKKIYSKKLGLRIEND